MRLGVYSVEEAGVKPEGGSESPEEGVNLENQQLRARVQELEAELASKKTDGEGLSEGDNDTIQQLKQRVRELEAALQDREKGKEGEEEKETVVSLKKRVEELEKALEQSKTAGHEEGEGAPVNGLQARVEELERALKESVPRGQFEEVQVTLGLQLNQLAQERAEVATRLNQALLELERLRPQSHIGEDEDDEDPSESSEVSIASGKYTCCPSETLQNNHLIPTFKYNSNFWPIRAIPAHVARRTDLRGDTGGAGSCKARGSTSSRQPVCRERKPGSGCTTAGRCNTAGEAPGDAVRNSPEVSANRKRAARTAGTAWASSNWARQTRIRAEGCAKRLS